MTGRRVRLDKWRAFRIIQATSLAVTLTGDGNVYGMNPLENQTGSYHFSPEGLKLISRCPLCSESYQPFQASIVEEKEEAQLLHIQCRKCQSCIVALIVNGQLGLTSVGLITDLTSGDVEFFKDAPGVSESLVLEAFSQLKQPGASLHKALITE